VKEWLTDITTLNGVESLFHRPSVRDPWASSLAGAVADFYAYSPAPCFVLPAPSARAAGTNAPAVPSIVEAIQSLDSTTLRPIEYSTAESRTLEEEHLNETLAGFVDWCRLNPARLRQWVALHREPWITGGHAVRVPNRYVYNVEKVIKQDGFAGNALLLGVSTDDLAYSFDVALRYGIYGEVAGDRYYLSHPIREQQTFATMSVKPHPSVPVAVSFAPCVARLARSLSLDQYTSLLCEIRALVHDRGLASFGPGSIEPQELREIAANLQLPVRLKGWAKAAGVGAAGLSVFAAFPSVAVPVSTVAAVVTVSQIFWDGRLPRRSGRLLKWLRLPVHWQLEDQPK
jgi:hypothetical protein